MKVFLSWSGNRSKAVAELFATWLPLVVQRLEPWISTEIDKGAPWLEELTSEMGKAGTGIVCLTRENRTAPWILFEAGALARGLTRNRVCTFLVDVEPKDVDKPLSQFQGTLPQKTDVFGLVTTLNSQLQETDKLNEERLTRSFDTFWPQFEGPFKQIVAEADPVVPVPPRPVHDILNEILDTVRSLERKVGSDSASMEPDWQILRQYLDLRNMRTRPDPHRMKLSELIRFSLAPQFGSIYDAGTKTILEQIITDELVIDALKKAAAKMETKSEDAKSAAPAASVSDGSSDAAKRAPKKPAKPSQ